MAILKKDKQAALVNKLAAMPRNAQAKAMKKINDLVESLGMSEAEAYSKVLGGTTAMNIGGIAKKGAKRATGTRKK
jgi:hypothetical protein